VASVSFDDVAKVYPDGTRAVSGLDLEISDGEFMVLVGPSGSGKTTALRMVAGLEEISEGVVLIGDRVVNHVPSRDRDIAMVFQSYALYPHLTVYDNIAFGLRLQKLKKNEIDGRIQEVARILGIEQFLKRKPRALSGGQRQRVAMGRAIVRQPQAFLMDEPLSNLDAKLRVQLRAELARLLDELGTTTIYVTHDQVEALTMGDRVAVMRIGELEQVDNPQQLYDRPVNVFVGGFIGSPAMNMVEATLEPSNGTLAAAVGSQRIVLGDEKLSAHPALRAYAGRTVILGVRPEDLEDAALAPGAAPDRRLRGSVVLREALGSEIVAHFDIDARPALTDDVRELAADVGEELANQAPHTTLVGRFGADSAVQKGQQVEVSVDTRALHFFDPDRCRDLRSAHAVFAGIGGLFECHWSPAVGWNNQAVLRVCCPWCVDGALRRDAKILT
jgi:multiple sugar transport system ATP-binding protein